MPGWGEYYLNYKVRLSDPILVLLGLTADMQALKKIINSYAAGRPASDASLLSLGQRPAKRTLSGDTLSPSQSSLVPTSSIAAPRIASSDLDPLPPETEPPAPSREGSIASEGTRRSESFKAHRDVFFFTLQRELEKVCQTIGYS